jgi:hypothetical protein
MMTFRLKLEEWVAVLGDERNATVEAHENVELGGLTIASVTKPLQQADAESVILTIRCVSSQANARWHSKAPPSVRGFESKKTKSRFPPSHR